HLAVGQAERAVRAAREVMSPAEVGELDALDRRDEHVARVRVRQRRPGPPEPIGMIDDLLVAGQRPAAVLRGEAELPALAACHRLVALPPEGDLHLGYAVESFGETSGVEPAGVEAVDLPRAVGGCNEGSADIREALF